MTLTEFLLARIAEDEADARVELERFIRDHGPAELVDTTWTHPYMDPRRVLADCKRDRRIVELHACRDLDAARPICDVCWDDTFMGHADYPCRTLRALALPHADHPDYDEEWKP